MADENKELEQFLQDLLDEEQKRHEEFLKGHWELMQMIEEARKEMHKRRSSCNSLGNAKQDTAK